MRLLFLSYFFPGPLGAMASWLAASENDQVIFASSRSRQEQALPNVQRVVLRSYTGKARLDPDWFDLWDGAIRAGKSARGTLEKVRHSGFDPDIIFCATSNGTAFGLRQIFPDSFIVNFLEDTTIFPAAQTKMRVNLQSIQIMDSNLTFAFSENTRHVFAPELRPLIRIAPRVIDCAYFSPEQAQPFAELKDCANTRLLTLFAHGLNEQELFHLWHGALLVLANCPDCRIYFLVPGIYMLKRLRLLPVDSRIADRLVLESHFRHDILRDLLCASSLSVFAGRNAPFGLLESMSCATVPMCAHGHYFLKNGWDMLELPIRNSDMLAYAVLEAMKEPKLLQETGKRARQTVLANFASATVMPRFFPEIEKACHEWNS